MLVRDVCETLGATPANTSLAKMQNVIPNWIEATSWKRATADDKWRIVVYATIGICPEYESVYDAWAQAGWPGVYDLPPWTS